MHSSVYSGFHSSSDFMWCNVPYKNLTSIRAGTDSLHFLKIISVFGLLVFSSMPVHIDISFSWSRCDHRVSLLQITKAYAHVHSSAKTRREMQLPRLNVSDTAYPFRNVMFRLYLVVVKSKQLFPLRSCNTSMLIYNIMVIWCIACLWQLCRVFPGRLLT